MIDIAELEKEWMSKYDLTTGRLKEKLSDECYEWARTHTEQTEELIKIIIKTELNNSYNEILSFLDGWIDILPEHKKLIAIWIIGTYFHKSFDTYPYLFLNAMKGSGKSRLLRIISWLQYHGNGEVLTNPSDSVMFRTASLRGIVLDEFESEKSKDKQTMREYLNACYKVGGIVYRMEKQKDKFVAVGYPLYTPIAMANINGVEDVLQDRCITIIMEKSANLALVKKIEDFHRNEILRKIKANLCKFCVELCSVYPIQNTQDAWNSFITDLYYTHTHTQHTIHYSTPQHIDSTATISSFNEEELFKKIDSTGIYGRNLELFFPLIIVARMLGEDVLNELINIVSAMNVTKRDDEFAESKDVSLIEFVSCAERHRFSYQFVHDLFSEFKTFIGNQGNDEESKWLNITWFGYALKRLKLVGDRKRVPKGQMIILNVDHAKEKIKIFKTIDELKPKQPEQNDSPKYCGLEFEEDNQIFLCGQLWKGGFDKRKICPKCSKKNELVKGGILKQ
jgi:hypothetical protein